MKKNVVIVTGVDHPAHDWQQTAPVLKQMLNKHPRMQATVHKKPSFLASKKLSEYDVVVMHWMNWKTEGPGEQAQQNLKGFVRNGGGMSVLHFASGAFHDRWKDEYEKLAGRVWDPDKPSHDPYGSFQVNIVDKKHPVTRGMNSFTTIDELYTCLNGETPIRVLAVARSKVTKQNEPMAFVLKPGAGRVFHTALGHNVKSMNNDGFVRLVRRGTAWAAGLQPSDTERKTPERNEDRK